MNQLVVLRKSLGWGAFEALFSQRACRVGDPGISNAPVKFCAVALLGILTAGCSTLLTVGQGLEQDAHFDCGDGHSMPRIYSGTNQSIRVMRAQPWYLSPLILADTLLSSVADFLVLGVTIPTQVSRGNMCVPDSTVPISDNRPLRSVEPVRPDLH